jgi:ferredoxin-nitrite reductase
VTCASQGALGFPEVETLARRIHRHFTANPRFERFPKKFKIGVEADDASRRHLIQDVGLLLAGSSDGVARYDLFVAGGLGREPQPGFLFEAGVSENRVIPLIEAIARVYAAHTPAGKRLKHLLRSIGEPEFRRLVALEPSAVEELPPVTGLPENLLPPAGLQRVSAGVFAGELTSDQLLALADIAEQWGGGFLVATADQDIAFHVLQEFDPARAARALEQAGFASGEVCLRGCPGSHQCLAGLSPTREIAADLLDGMGATARGLSWALSGCPNSCTQPQLADVGIVTSGLVKSAEGERTPRFDLYRSGAAAFGTLVESQLTLDQLYEKLREIA